MNYRPTNGLGPLSSISATVASKKPSFLCEEAWNPFYANNEGPSQHKHKAM